MNPPHRRLHDTVRAIEVFRRRLEDTDILAAVGAAAATNPDGSINLPDTAVDAMTAIRDIPDIGERACAGQLVFGRCWTSIAALMDRSKP
jgi:hypothetical protein